MKILITGGTGSLGTALSTHYVKLGHTVTILNKDGHKQAALRRVLEPLGGDVRYFLADICDRDAVMDACKGQDVVLQAAAMKRLELGEQFPGEYARVNIMGTANVAYAANARNIGRCLMVSTDKAPEASSQYGATKKIGEGIWLSHNNCNSKFSAIRYGNVLGSNGSVWHLWQDQLAKTGKIIVRYPDPTRFILTLDYAVKLIDDALNALCTHGGEVFIPGNLPSFSLWGLAREICPDQSKWIEEPLGPGEKQHETLLAQGENAYRVSDMLWGIKYANGVPMTHEDRIQFLSRTARALTGKGVVEMMEGKGG